jgi:hypothetical protein
VRRDRAVDVLQLERHAELFEHECGIRLALPGK